MRPITLDFEDVTGNGKIMTSTTLSIAFVVVDLTAFCRLHKLQDEV